MEKYATQTFLPGAANELAQCLESAGKYVLRKEISVEMELETSGIEGCTLKTFNRLPRRLGAALRCNLKKLKGGSSSILFSPLQKYVPLEKK